MITTGACRRDVLLSIMQFTRVLRVGSNERNVLASTIDLQYEYDNGSAIIRRLYILKLGTGLKTEYLVLSSIQKLLSKGT